MLSMRTRHDVVRIVLFLLFGLVIGAIVGIVIPGRAPRGWVMSMVIAAAGSMVGGLLASALGLNTEGSRSGFVLSVLGAVTWLALYHLIRRRAGSRPGRAPPGARSRDRSHYHRRSTDTDTVQSPKSG